MSFLAKRRAGAASALAEIEPQRAISTPPPAASVSAAEPAAASVARKLRLSWLFGRRPNVRHRREPRYSCHVSATMALIEEGFDIHGDLLDISPSGALFRPSSRFVLAREGDSVVLRMRAIEQRAAIMNSSPRGYGLRFSERLNTELFRSVLAQSRSKPERS